MRNNSVCSKLFDFLHDDNVKYDRFNTSFSKQLNSISNCLHIECSKYSYKTSLAVIDFKFKYTNQGLIDSISFLLNNITRLMNNGSEYLFMYDEINNLLKPII